MPTLRPTQVEDVNTILNNRLRAIVANAPGTGKTATAIVALAKSAHLTTPCLVVAPASVTRNWVKEFKMWAPGLHPQLIESTTPDPTRGRKGDVFILSWAFVGPSCGCAVEARPKGCRGGRSSLCKEPGHRSLNGTSSGLSEEPWAPPADGHTHRQQHG